jgi:valyl-tRNA synthetase
MIRMLLPPPNITGELHIGHALMLSIEDALARYYRMNSHSVIWAPGTDHAGIATQLVVERMLERERGVTRQELGREAFLQEMHLWREKYGRRILEQIKELGVSTTNSKEYYTMDPDLSEAVSAAFVRLWKEGLVYRATRMVNWSVELQTAVSDIEVVTKDVSKSTKISG